MMFPPKDRVQVGWIKQALELHIDRVLEQTITVKVCEKESRMKMMITFNLYMGYILFQRGKCYEWSWMLKLVFRFLGSQLGILILFLIMIKELMENLFLSKKWLMVSLAFFLLGSKGEESHIEQIIALKIYKGILGMLVFICNIQHLIFQIIHPQC